MPSIKKTFALACLSSLGLGLSTSKAFSAETLVYMREDSSGKQIWAKDTSTGTETPLTKGNLWHLYPDISPDGTKLVYVEGSGPKDLSVVLKNMKTGATSHLTGAGAYLHPSFSGDGRFVALSGPLGSGGEERIGIVDLKHPSSAIRVIDSTEKSYFPALSSDGSFVVFQRSKADGSKDIVEMDLRTSTLRAITPPNGKNMAPDLSFDDRYITYASNRDGNWDIFVFDRETETEHRLTTDRGDDMAPSFDPSGNVVFASSRSGHFALYEVSNWNSSAKAQERPLVATEAADLYAPTSSGDSSWQQSNLAPMLAPARSSFGAVAHQGRIYVAGGHQGPEHTYPPESFVGALEYYDIKTGQWHTAAHRQTPSHGFGIVAHGDYVYAFGGFAYSEDHQPHWHSLDTIERYSIKENKWEVIGHLPHARSSNVVAKVGTKVWLIGGWDSTPRFPGDRDGRFMRSIDVFDLETETASETAYQLPDPLRRALTAVVRDGKITLLGGLGEGASHFVLLDNVTEFDPQTGTWTELPRLPFATFAPAAGVLDNQILIFGGMYKTGPQSYNYVNHIFSLSSEGWLHTGRYLHETKGFSMVVNLDSRRLGILGGHSYQDETDAPVSSFEVFGLK